MKCNLLSCLLFTMVFLSIMTTKMMMVNALQSDGTYVTCKCECMNWSEHSTPSEPMANCNTCNAAACRTMGGSCTSGTIIRITCT